MLTINSWGEWQIQRFHSENAVIDGLQHLLQYAPLARKQGWPNYDCHCFCASRAGAISQRVEKILADITSHTLEQPNVDYILEAGQNYYIWQQDKYEVRLNKAESVSQFLALLGRPRKQYAHYRLDVNALNGSPLKAIFNHPRPGSWQLFFWHKENTYFYYLLDERGVLLHQQQQAQSDSEVVIPIIRFLRQIDQRMQGQFLRQRARPILLFELKRNNESTEFEPHSRRLPPLQSQTSHIQLNATLDDQDQVTLYCNGEEFSVWEWGDQLYNKVAKTLLAMRSSNDDYPAYLTDLSLYSDASIIQHIKLKQGIEKRLNQALSSLAKNSN